MSRTKIDPATLYSDFGAIQAHLAKVRELLADNSTHYHNRLMVALSAMVYISELREALLKRDSDLADRVRAVTQSKFSGIAIGRANGEPREESFSRSTEDRLPTPDAIATLRREVAEFREIANTLRLDAVATVTAAHNLAWQSFAEVRKAHKPMAVTRELCSFLRAYIDPHKIDGRLPNQEKLCGLVDRSGYTWREPTKTVLRFARQALKRPTEVKRGNAPSLKAGRDIVAHPYRLGRQPCPGALATPSRTSPYFRAQLPDIVAKYVRAGIYTLETYFSSRNSPNEFNSDHTCLLPLLRREVVTPEARAGARWVRMMQTKGIISKDCGTTQVIVGKPRELVTDGTPHAEFLGFEIRQSDFSRLPAGHTIRVIPVKAIRYGKPIDTMAIILCGPDASGIEWAHENASDLTPSRLSRIVDRFIGQIDSAKRAAERARLWNLSEAERKKLRRKQMLTLACRMRALESISFADSRRAGNCAPGTEGFMATIGLDISTRSISGRKLAQLWRKAKFPSDSLLSLAVSEAEKRAAQLAADRKLLADLESMADTIPTMEPEAVNQEAADDLNHQHDATRVA